MGEGTPGQSSGWLPALYQQHQGSLLTTAELEESSVLVAEVHLLKRGSP